MSRELNRAFMRDPVRFMERNVTDPPSFIPGQPARLAPDGHPGDIEVAGPYGQLWGPGDIPEAPDQKRLEVTGFGNAAPLAWLPQQLFANLEEVDGVVGRKISIHFTEQAEVGDENFPCWFLPWIPDGLTYFRLLNGPRYFFTSALSGCAVWATGPLHSPVVYHGNARSLVAENGEPTYEEYQEYMDDLFDGVIGYEADLRVRRLKLTKRDYMRTEYHQERKEARGRILEEPPEVLPTCVFGFRRNNQWRFFFQENVGLRYSRPVTAVWSRLRKGAAFDGVRTRVYPLPADPNV